MTIHPLDRSRFLHPQHSGYAEQLTRFFEWQLDQDGEDLTTNLLFSGTSKRSEAEIVARQNGVLAGREEIEFFSRKYPELELTWYCDEGKRFTAEKKIITWRGPERLLLRLERIFLNVLARMSGIATLTAALVEKLPDSVALAATRKTLWGTIDKKAVAIGGGLTHRLGLFDAVLVKENHLGLIPKGAVSAAEQILKSAPEKLGAFWEIEVETPEEFRKVWKIMTAKKMEIPGVIMLDNFKPSEIMRLVKEIQPKKFLGIFLEASGGITPKNILEFANTGVHILSLGYLTHSASPIDFSMRIIGKTEK